MSERKVLTKYYPPDFDPSKIGRTPKHLRPTGPKTIPVRLMAPFSMKCTSCGEYIYKGRKFNARKETTDEKYLNITIYRFYIRCTRCSSEITFKTDPKNMDYTCERGAKRNFESWRNPESTELKETDEERLDRLEREEAEEAENAERNAMEELEEKMEESKREMQVADALDEIMQRNARIERGEKGSKEEDILVQVRDLAREQRETQEREDAEAARLAFESTKVAQARLEQATEAQAQNSKQIDEDATPQPPPSFEKVKKAKKPLVPGLVRKTQPTAAAAAAAASPVPTTTTASTKPVGLNLGDYDSDDD
ncbi:Pre-mRNA-splicing factor cwf16 [Knufia peltigerae]|uniref:Splicing factor YJU2 n=1 Tax=Knufia peltigerae TaxID=1002370 RepID=A0AA39CUL3_9EURO|nr:Pre-mRNA-splicing factor cwf16 [Knufia peltigerae]